jgi:hypothetical protein
MYVILKLAGLFLRQNLTMYPGWPQTRDPPASAFHVLELLVCATTPSSLKDFQITVLGKEKVPKYPSVS